ncbi:MAG: hypothetical protein ACPG4T_23065, partial [Nannocystaceae bacterium]
MNRRKRFGRGYGPRSWGLSTCLSLAVLCVSTSSQALPREGLWKGREGEPGSNVPRAKAGRGSRSELEAPKPR